jgi:hypothetical protein
MDESFGFDRDDLDRLLRGAGDQMRSVLGQFGRFVEGSQDQTGWSTLFDDFGRGTRPAPEPETAGAAGDGVWAIFTVDDGGGAQVEQVYATELDALRANSPEFSEPALSRVTGLVKGATSRKSEPARKKARTYAYLYSP